MNRSPIKNPQTWTRLRRIELRRLANEIGNEAMALTTVWPKDGSGRAIKLATENIARQMDNHTGASSLPQAFDDIIASSATLNDLLKNDFFEKRIAYRMWKGGLNGKESYRDVISRLALEIPSDVDAFNQELSPRTPDEILRDITPPQKLGPVEFVFDEGVLRIIHRPAEPGDAERAIAEQARESLSIQAERLLVQLRSTNQDERIVILVSEAANRIEKRRDIIALGMANFAVQLVVQECVSELAEVLTASLRAFTVGVSMYLAQFPEWARFSENAAMVEYTSKDIEQIHSAGLKLVEELRVAGKSVDDEIPRTIQWMLDAMRNPRQAATRSIFGAIRTIENLVSIIFRTFSGWLGASDEGVKKGITAAVKPVVAMLLLTAAANIAGAISPTAARVLHTDWMGLASKLVQKEIDAFSSKASSEE